MHLQFCGWWQLINVQSARRVGDASARARGSIPQSEAWADLCGRWTVAEEGKSIEREIGPAARKVKVGEDWRRGTELDRPLTVASSRCLRHASPVDLHVSNLLSNTFGPCPAPRVPQATGTATGLYLLIVVGGCRTQYEAQQSFCPRAPSSMVVGAANHPSHWP